MFWYIVYVCALLALLMHLRGPNAVWGTATLGIFIGFVVAALSARFEWWSVVQAGAIGALLGALFEYMPRLIRNRE